MPFGALAGAIAAGRTKFRSTTPRGKGRRPRPISSGPKTGRRPGRKLTTSQAAIRRSEERRGIRTTGPKPPTSRGPRRPSRTINTGPSRPRRVMTNPPRAVRGVPRRKGRGTFAGRLVRGTHARRR